MTVTTFSFSKKVAVIYTIDNGASSKESLYKFSPDSTP